VIGYSTGAALAVLHALEAVENPSLARIDRIVVLFPAIGVTSMAALAVWQARPGHLLGPDKLAWSDLLPEYDLFKYGSFAVNAGDVVYRLTSEIQRRIAVLGRNGGLDAFPPILAFSSVVDATVSTPALVSGLFTRLPRGGHELVLFDINRRASIEPLMKANPTAVLSSPFDGSELPFTLSVVANADADSSEVVIKRQSPDGEDAVEPLPGLAWPGGVYSLSHVALPFPAEDGLYGGRPAREGSGLHLGSMALRGERGVLQVGTADMLRLRWNPFSSYVEERVPGFSRSVRPPRTASVGVNRNSWGMPHRGLRPRA
jgi:alpha-beta hydrolase superfamily lysophospholipase